MSERPTAAIFPDSSVIATQPALTLYTSFEPFSDALPTGTFLKGSKDTQWCLGTYGSRSAQAHVLHGDRTVFISLNDFRPHEGYDLPPDATSGKSKATSDTTKPDPFRPSNYNPAKDSQMLYVTYFAHNTTGGSVADTQSTRDEWKSLSGVLSVREGQYPATQDGRATRVQQKILDIISSSAGTSHEGETADEVITRETLSAVEPYAGQIARMLVEQVESVLPMPEPQSEAMEEDTTVQTSTSAEE